MLRAFNLKRSGTKHSPVKLEEQNDGFLKCCPKRSCEWEESEKQLAVMLIPKFGQHFFGRWMLARMQKPTYRLTLDEIGSFVWERCDGTHTIEQIGNEMSAKFGKRVEPVFERLGSFFQRLARTKSITWV